MADSSQWKWSYFTLESISKVKCSLCNSVHKPRLYTSKHPRKHLRNKKADPVHNKAFNDCVFNLYNKRKKKNVKNFKWDSHFKIISSNITLKPNVKCKHCKADIPVSNDDKPFLSAPKDLGEHLNNAHKIKFKNWVKFENWIRKYAAKDYGPNIFRQQKNMVIKVDRCKECNDEIRAENAIMFVKHLIDKHHQKIKHFPPDIIPNELLLDFDPDDTFDDIPTDDLLIDDILEIPGSPSSNQPSDISNISHISQGSQQQSNTMANVLDDSSQSIDAQASSFNLRKKPSMSRSSSKKPPSKRKERRLCKIVR